MQLVHVWVLWCVHVDYPAGARVGSMVCAYGLPCSWCTCGFYGVYIRTTQLVHVWFLWYVHMDYPAGARVGSLVCTHGITSE